VLEKEGLTRNNMSSLEARSAEGDGGSHLLIIVARRRRWEVLWESEIVRIEPAIWVINAGMSSTGSLTYIQSSVAKTLGECDITQN